MQAIDFYRLLFFRELAQLLQSKTRSSVPWLMAANSTGGFHREAELMVVWQRKADGGQTGGIAVTFKPVDPPRLSKDEFTWVL